VCREREAPHHTGHPHRRIAAVRTQHKLPLEIRAWAHVAYPKVVAAARPGKISTVTIIPGYDD
jgi:hypothetical protein